jgi:rRNA-processing protein FCF1
LRGVAVGSANVGRDALQTDGNLLEAMIVTHDDATVAAADRWLKALLKSMDTIPLAKLRASKDTWAVLLKRWERPMARERLALGAAG